MEVKGKFIEWRFNFFETVAFMFSCVCVAVSITLWSTSTFQSKVDADAVKTDLQAKIQAVDARVTDMQKSVQGVAVDVSYIRGRLEPKASDKNGP